MPDPDFNEDPEKKIGSCPRCFKKDFKDYHEYLEHIMNC